jgi:DDE superfamily endonuclease
MSARVESRFEEYCSALVAVLGHADRHEPAKLYLKGLLLPGERKSVEPMAARVCPENVRSAHQSMNHRATRKVRVMIDPMESSEIPSFRGWSPIPTCVAGGVKLGRQCTECSQERSANREGSWLLAASAGIGLGVAGMVKRTELPETSTIEMSRRS